MSDKWDEIQKDISELDDGIFDDSQVLELSRIIDNELNKKAKKASRKTIIYLIAIVVILYFIISPIVKLGYPNPKKFEKEMIGEYWSKMDMILEAEFNLSKPYFRYRDSQVKDLGFGNYEINLMTHDKTAGAMRNPDVCAVDISRGGNGYCDTADSLAINAFQYHNHDVIVNTENINRTLDIVNGLPDSAAIFSETAFIDLQKLYDVFKMFEDNEDDLMYVNVYGKHCNNILGITMERMQGYVIEDEKTNLKYPNLSQGLNNGDYLNRVDEYTQHFKSTVNYLYNNKLYSVDDLNLRNMRKYVNKKDFEVESKGVISKMSKKEFLDFYENNKELISDIHIEDINLY